MSQAMSDIAVTELQQMAASWESEYKQLISGNNVRLDLSRGKPAPEQLALSDSLDGILHGNFITPSGIDTRNYGNVLGIPEARALGAELMGVPANEVVAGGNSSLSLMHFVLGTAMHQGFWGDQRRWRNDPRPKLLTPVPGYDRHFALSESFGLEMINIPMAPAGPDMQRAAELAANDPSIKGIWCVPKYSNPTGNTYSQDIVDAMAVLPQQAASDDFVVLWDNAYAVHDLDEAGDILPCLREACLKVGTYDHVVQFASTSKITLASGGVGFIAVSENVLKVLEKHLSVFVIGPDKVNQLRHVKFLGGRLKEHMAAHAAIVRPKFERVLTKLRTELADLKVANWTEPKGGYFISLDVQPGLAKKVITLAGAAGLTLTPAGATFPYGKDPLDKNIRIAPTFAQEAELEQAMHILTLCIKLVSAQATLGQQKV